MKQFGALLRYQILQDLLQQGQRLICPNDEPYWLQLVATELRYEEEIRVCEALIRVMNQKTVDEAGGGYHMEV